MLFLQINFLICIGALRVDAKVCRIFLGIVPTLFPKHTVIKYFRKIMHSTNTPKYRRLAQPSKILCVQIQGQLFKPLKNSRTEI